MPRTCIVNCVLLFSERRAHPYAVSYYLPLYDFFVVFFVQVHYDIDGKERKTVK